MLNQKKKSGVLLCAVGVSCAAVFAALAPSAARPNAQGTNVASSISEAELIDMRSRQDVKGMRNHAWQLYSNLIKPSDPSDPDSPPIWDTWEDKAQVFSEQSQLNVDHSKNRELEFPIEVLAAIRAENADDSAAMAAALAYMRERGVGPEVLYNPDAASHIRKNKLHTVKGLNDRLTELEHLNSPVSESSIVEFPASSIVLKAMWLTVGPKSPSVLSIWDPPNKAIGRCEYGCSRTIKVRLAAEGQPCNLPTNSKPVLSSCFYSVRDTTRQGYKLVLFGLHVATKEIRDWTWSTFWWQVDADKGPYAYNRPDESSVNGFWRNYVMDTTLSMVTPEGQSRVSTPIPKQRCQVTQIATAKICFNPYIEPETNNGRLSNCMNCHRQATYPAMEPDPRGTSQQGFLSSDDPCFGELKSAKQARVMKLDYLWSLSLVNPDKPLGKFLGDVKTQWLLQAQ